MAADFDLVTSCVSAWLNEKPQTVELQPETWQMVQWHRFEGIMAEMEIQGTEQVEKVKRRMTLHNMRHQALLVEISKGFEQAQVGFAIIKGQSLMQRAYRSASLRTSKDIDLLVSPFQASNAIDSLKGLGFEFPDIDNQYRRLEHSVVGYRDGQLIDLHWRLDSPAFPFHPARKLDLSHSAMEVGGRQIRLMDPPLEFAYLVYHGAKHLWFRWIWLLDLAVYLRANPMTSTMKAAVERTGQTHALEVADALARDLFDTPLLQGPTPSPARHDADQIQSLWRRHTQRDPYGLRFSPATTFRTNLRFTRSWLGKCRRVAAALFIPSVADYRAFGSSRTRPPWIWVLRPWRIIFGRD